MELFPAGPTTIIPGLLSASHHKGSVVRLLRIFAITCLLAFPSILFAADDIPLTGRVTIDDLLDRAVSNKLISGGVVVIGNHAGILRTIARGRLNADPAAPPISAHTIFDIASLTKVTATTPAVMKLLEQGRISLLDPLSRWFPEFRGSGPEEITILSLLTHTSGLADFDMGVERTMETAVSKAAAQPHRPGSRFHYADINFILLGELVRRVSGMPLDVFCREQLYEPLGLQETMFLPPGLLAGTIAPTSGPSVGIVQDLNARRLGGVAGHAGLFSSAEDLGRYARLVLGGGDLNGKRILSERIISQMTAPYFCSSGSVVRGLGWDRKSPFSAPKGIFFSDSSFGHTGYSGSSIWIDPERDLFVILLTIRTNYRDTGMFSQLRSDVSTIGVADFSRTGDKPGILLAAATARDFAAPAKKLPKFTFVASLDGKPAVQASLKKQFRKHPRRQIGRSVRMVAKAGDTGRRIGKRAVRAGA